MFKGKREDGVDYFDDILTEQGGIHEGRALGEFEGIKEQITPEGLKVTTSCRLCGKKHDVWLDWKELYVVGANGLGAPPLLPEGWDYSENNSDAFVQLRCSKCNQPGISVHMTPEEARQAVNTAQSRGFIQQQQAAQWRQQVVAARGG